MTHNLATVTLLLVLGYTAGTIMPRANAEIIGEMQPFLQELTAIRRELAGVRQELAGIRHARGKQ